MINKYNTAVAIDAVRILDVAGMYKAEAPIQLEAMVYVTAYAFDPLVAKEKVEQALRDLGYEGEVYYV